MFSLCKFCEMALWWPLRTKLVAIDMIIYVVLYAVIILFYFISVLQTQWDVLYKKKMKLPLKLHWFGKVDSKWCPVPVSASLTVLNLIVNVGITNLQPVSSRIPLQLKHLLYYPFSPVGNPSFGCIVIRQLYLNQQKEVYQQLLFHNLGKNKIFSNFL
jgi:hypothetical protein